MDEDAAERRSDRERHERAMEAEPNLKVTLPNFVDEGLLLNNLEKYK